MPYGGGVKPNPFARAALVLLVFLLSFNVQTAWAQDLTISSNEDWNTFAAAVNKGTSYSGQTVVLTDDITVSTMVGTSDYKFEGTFHGNGHTLTFNATADEEYCAPFRFIKGATINCLKVAGKIETGYKYAGGIVGNCSGNCTIQNCQSSIAIISTVGGGVDDDGDGTHGGFVSMQEDDASLTISNCLFDGSIEGSQTTNCGGFVGWRCNGGTLIYNNCLMAGSMSINQDAESALFNRNGGSTLNNCYYDESKGYVTITAQGTATTATDNDLQTLLGSNWQVNGTSVEPIMTGLTIISSDEDWNTFADAVNNGKSYIGQTVALTADIKVSTMAGTSEDKRFQGTFLGNGHTLTFDVTATEEQCAPFRFINGATIKFLKVAGKIETGYKYAGGIAGYCSGNCTIQNCQSSITINSTVDGDGTHGGFVSMQQNASLTISNCLFDGIITGSQTTNCGGFVGWRCAEGTLIFNNCLMAGSMSINQDAESALFNRNGGSTLTNCFYDKSKGYGAITAQGTDVTTNANDLQTLLGSGWVVNGTSVEPIIMKDLTIISSEEDWNIFAAVVNKGTSYSGQTVVLTADITVSTMAGTNDNRFQGTFLGNGHTLTFNATATDEKCAPFRFINGATIKCLKVAGTIKTGYKYAGGIAGYCSGACTIQNCHSSITINSTVSGDGTHGGFVGLQEDDASLTISNCLLDGSISGSQTTNCGGFVGWRCNGGTLIFNNCLMAGSMSINQDANSALFNRNGGSTLNNCYYDNSKNYGTITAQGDVATTNAKDLQTLLGSNWQQVNGTSVEPIMDDKNLGTATISGISSSLFYTGKPYTITCAVTALDGSALSEGTHYTATITKKDGSGSTVQELGDYTLTITAIEGSGYTGTQTFDFTVSSTPPGMSVDNEIEEGTVGHYYVNMPKEGSTTISISEGFTSSFKVYDDGGKDGNYSNNCNGTLIITVPENHFLMLTGTVTSEEYDDNWDYLQYYDGENTSDDYKYGNEDGESIGTHISSGPKVKLYFKSNSDDYSGIDLTVKVCNLSTKHTVTIETVEGGTITANPSEGSYDETITLTAEPEEGFIFLGASVTDEDFNEFEVHSDWYKKSNTATFTMPYANVTVTPKFTDKMTADGGLFINMPKTEELTVEIPDGVKSFKVYDDGGSAGNYSNDCDGYLVLTAPEGYLLQLSGKIWIDQTYDYLTAYDGKDNTGTILLDQVSSNGSGNETDIETVVSRGHNMTLYFHSNYYNYDYCDGLDLTVTLVDQNTDFNITVNSAEGGSVICEPATAKVHETVTLTASPQSGYILSDISVVDASNNAISVEWNLWDNTATFEMPGSAVTVNPTFTNDLTNLSVNMPKTDTKYVTIPQGVQSIKVYDDGGSAGYYSNYCGGYLVLTAPEGYLLQLSGNITTEEGYDYLTAYDGKDNTGPKLLDQVSSNGSGNETDIETVVSRGHNMTLFFHSDESNYSAGLDLTVTLLPVVIDGNSDATVTFTEKIENATVIFKRDFTQGVNSTLILPFGFTLTDDFKTNYGNFYFLQDIHYNDADNQWEGWLENAVDKVEANTPYVFVPSKDFTSITFTGVTIEPTTPIDVTFGGDNNDDWTFKGTYSQIENFETHDKPIYGFAGTNNSSIAVGEFVRANKSKVSIKPLRCYLEYNGNNPNLSKSALELPDRIVLRIIDSTIDPGDPTENPDTDITTPTSELSPAANVKVWSYDKTICIAAAPNTPYRIIDATGRVLKDGITQTDRDEIRLGNHSGIAIVVINNKTFKVSY